MTDFQPRFRQKYDRIPEAGEVLFTGEGEMYAVDPAGGHHFPLHSVHAVDSTAVLITLPPAFRSTKRLYRAGNDLYRWNGGNTNSISDWTLLNLHGPPGSGLEVVLAGLDIDPAYPNNYVVRLRGNTSATGSNIRVYFGTRTSRTAASPLTGTFQASSNTTFYVGGSVVPGDWFAFIGNSNFANLGNLTQADLTNVQIIQLQYASAWNGSGSGYPQFITCSLCGTTYPADAMHVCPGSGSGSGSSGSG